MAAAKVDYEDELTCPICAELFNDPRLLSCSHTFCKGCLQRWIDTSKHHGQFQCPTCNTLTQIPTGGADRFPVNRIVKSLVKNQTPITGRLYPQLPSKGEDMFDVSMQLSRMEVQPSGFLFRRPQASAPYSTQAMKPGPHTPVISLMSNIIIRRKTHVPVKDEVKCINDLEVLENGNIVAVRYPCIQLLDRQLRLKRNFTWPRDEDGGAVGAARTHDSNIAVCLHGRNKVFIFDINGKYLSSIHNGLLSQVNGVRMNSCGELVLIDGLVVRHIDYNTGDVLTPTRSGLFVEPNGVTTNSKDIVIVTDSGACCIIAINRAGEVQFKYGSRGSGEQELLEPAGVCCDQHDNIIIADCHNHRVILLNATGQFIKHLLRAHDGLTVPISVAIDSTGHLLVGTQGGDIYTVQYQQ